MAGVAWPGTPPYLPPDCPALALEGQAGQGGPGRAGTVPKDPSPRSLAQELACLPQSLPAAHSPGSGARGGLTLLSLPSWKTAPPAPMGPRGPRAAGTAATETPSGGGRPGSKARGLAGGLNQQLPPHSSGHQACAAGVSCKIPSGSPSPRGWNPRAEAGTRNSSQRAGGRLGRGPPRPGARPMPEAVGGAGCPAAGQARASLGLTGGGSWGTRVAAGALNWLPEAPPQFAVTPNGSRLLRA